MLSFFNTISWLSWLERYGHTLVASLFIIINLTIKNIVFCGVKSEKSNLWVSVKYVNNLIIKKTPKWCTNAILLYTKPKKVYGSAGILLKHSMTKALRETGNGCSASIHDEKKSVWWVNVSRKEWIIKLPYWGSGFDL